MNLSLSALTPKNREIAAKLFPDFDARDTGPTQINALMDAARQQGAQEVQAQYEAFNKAFRGF